MFILISFRHFGLYSFELQNDPSTPFSSVIMNAWSCTSAPPISLYFVMFYSLSPRTTLYVPCWATCKCPKRPQSGTVSHLMHLDSAVGPTEDPSRTHSHNIGPKSGPRLVVYLVEQTQGLLNAETHHTSVGHISGCVALVNRARRERNLLSGLRI
jgi:hypothetical protein